VERQGYELGDQYLIPSRGRKGLFSLSNHVQTSSEAHPSSYPMGGTGGSFLMVKAAGACR